ADRARELVHVDPVRAVVGRLQHLEIPAWQQDARVGDIDGVARELHAVLRCAQRGRAYALAGWEEWPGQGGAVGLAAQREGEEASHVAEIARLPLIQVFGDAPRKHDAGYALQIRKGIGQVQTFQNRGQRPGSDAAEQGVRHAVRDTRYCFRRRDIAAAPTVTGLRRKVASGGVEPHDALIRVYYLQAPSDVYRSRCGYPPVLDHCELRGAASDVDIEQALPRLVGCRRGAGAVGGERGLHMMPRGRAHELPALIGQQAGDGFCVLAPQCLARQDHHARVDIVRMQSGLLVRGVDDGAQSRLVDALLALVRRKRDRRLEQRFPRDHEIAAGKVFREPPQIQPREDDLRAGGSDIDAYADQGNVILQPQRVLFGGACAVEVIVVVIRGFVAVVRMVVVFPVAVVLERMRPPPGRVVIVFHRWQPRGAPETRYRNASGSPRYRRTRSPATGGGWRQTRGGGSAWGYGGSGGQRGRFCSPRRIAAPAASPARRAANPDRASNTGRRRRRLFHRPS